MSGTQKEKVVASLAPVSALAVSDIPALLSAARADRQQAYMILEQYRYPDFMSALYALDSPDLHWNYLFDSDRDEDLRKAGPILVWLNTPELMRFAVQSLAEQDAGCLLTSTEDFDATLAWGRARLTLISPAGAKAVCRFYDPDSLAYFVSAMTEDERQRFWHQGTRLIWPDTFAWWQRPLYPTTINLVKRYQLSQAHLEQIDEYKLLQARYELAAYYAEVRPRDDISVPELTEKVFELARSHGATDIGDYDAWLRLALVRGQAFYQTGPASQHLNNPEYPLHKRLALIERESEYA